MAAELQNTNKPSWHADLTYMGTILPGQWAGLHGPSLCGSQGLALAILADAIKRIQKPPRITGIGRFTEYQELVEDYAWIESDEERYVFSFVTICYNLHIDPNVIRMYILTQYPPEILLQYPEEIRTYRDRIQRRVLRSKAPKRTKRPYKRSRHDVSKRPR